MTEWIKNSSAEDFEKWCKAGRDASYTVQEQTGYGDGISITVRYVTHSLVTLLRVKKLLNKLINDEMLNMTEQEWYSYYIDEEDLPSHVVFHHTKTPRMRINLCAA